MVAEAQVSAYKTGLVRFYKGDKVIGAGVYVQNGYVLTCAHVVTESLELGKKLQGIKLDSVVGKPVKLDFPFFSSEQPQNAEVEPALWMVNAEDLAVLKLSEAVPEGVSPPPLAGLTDYRNHRFRVYGFPEGHRNGVWSEGKFVEEIASGRVQLEGTQTQGIAIEPGFSGAPVWDEKSEKIAGITVARDQEREEAKVSFMIPLQRLKPALDAIALFELLLPASAELTSHWQAAYKLLRPERSTEDQPTTLQEAIVQLQDTSARGSAFTSIHLFVGYLAQPALGLSIQPELIQWLIQQGTDIKVLLQEVQKKVDQKQAKQSLGQNPYLLFWVQAELNSDRYSVQAYLVSDRERYDPLQATQLTAPATYLEQSSDEKVDREGLKVILRECLDESIGFLTGQNPFDITINLFLPIACVSWAVDHWLADEETEFNPAPEPIGSRYQVVLRIAERLNPQIVKPQLQALWHRKWNTLEHIQHRPAGESLIQADNQVPRTLTITLRSPEIVGFYLVKPPEALLEGNATLFHTLLGSGTPIAIWPRQILMDSCQQRLRECLDSCLAELSRNVQNLRQSAHQVCQEGETHIGHHLGLIWEDPKLVPPIDSRTSRLRMPA